MLILQVLRSTTRSRAHVLHQVVKTQSVNVSHATNEACPTSLVRKSTLNVTTIGHQGHGKSTLTDALLAISGRCFNFEPQAPLNRNASNASLCEYFGTDYRILHTDCPGDPSLIKNMITNSQSNEVAVLVVDGEHGVQQQTREHLLIASHMGTKRFVVFIDCKSDSVDDETLQLIEMDIRDMFDSKSIPLDKDAIVVGNAMAALSPDSSDHQRKIETLIDLIERQATTIRKSHSNSKLDPLIFSIKKVYTKANRGTEVTGVIESGIIHKGDNVEIVGYDKVFRTSVLNIESFRRSQTETGAGESAALLLKSIKKEDVCRGMMVITADNLDLVDAKQRIQVSSNSTTPKNHPFRVHMSDHLRAEIQLLDSIDNPKAKPLSNCNSNLIMFGRTFDIRTLVRFIDSNHQSHGPGDRFEVDLKLLKSMAITLHQPFVLRDSASTIAFGRISKIQSASTLTDRDSITVHRK